MILLNSCETQEIVLTEHNNSNPIYNSVISSYLTNFKTSISNNKENTKKISALMQAIDYNTIKQYDLKNTIKLVVVDLKNFSVFSEADQTKAIFFVLNNSIIRSNIVTIKNKLPFENPDQVIVSIFDKKENKDNYSGKIEFYNLFQNILLSNEFENGKLTVNGIARIDARKSLTAKCRAWYWVTSYSDGSQTADYMFTTCDCEEQTYRTECGGGGGGGGTSTTSSSPGQPNYPQNPKDKDLFTYIDWDGEIVTKQFNEEIGIWELLSISLPDLVIQNNPEKYSFLLFAWPQDQQKIVNNNLIYTYDGASGSWEGEPATDEALDDVILDPSFNNNPCLMDTYSKLGGGVTFQNFLQKFDNKFSIVDLKLTVGNSTKNPEASAWTFEPVNRSIEIRFNPTKLGTPQLNIARTFIHEMIHAEIYRQLLSVAGTPNIPWSADFINSVKDDFPVLADYYTRFVYNVPAGQQPSSAQHELMADHYRDIIIQAMKEFDPTQSDETYTALSWIGLMGSGKIDDVTGLPPLPTVAWKNISQAQRKQLLNIFYNFRDTNTPCQ